MLMSDDTAQRGEADRRQVAGEQAYELRYFARKHGLTTAQAMDLIRRIGNDRPKLNEAAVKLRRSLKAVPK
jgi:LmbE family N-acetylglucosaminyl deacetylase